MSSIDLKKSTIKATNMRVVLVICLLLLLSLMAGGFYLAYLNLKNVSTEVTKVQTEASSSDAQIAALQKTEQDLEEYADVVTRARDIVAESKSYQYQDQIIDTLTTFANQSGLSISSFSFQADSDTTGSSTATQQPPTEGGQASASPSGSLKSTMVSVQLVNNIPYTNMLNFIHLIESNITKMQISQLSMANGENYNTVNVQTLNVEVYLR